MTIPSGGWDNDKPAGSRQINLGDNDIREVKAQVQEVLEVDHQLINGTDANNGKHDRCSFIEAADIGSGAEGLPILGAQTIGGKPELVYTDEDDNDIQITNVGAINVDISASVINAIVYPVGSVYANAAVSTNPETLLGFTSTWVAIEGECVVGLVAGGEFDTLGSVSEGETTHQLTEAELAAHGHFTVKSGNSSSALSASNSFSESYSVSGDESYAGKGGVSPADYGLASDTGSDTAHNNIQPSYVCYVWRRTA